MRTYRLIRVHTWADGFGIWRARVNGDACTEFTEDRAARTARNAIYEELRDREGPRIARGFVRVARTPEHDESGHLAFREA